MEEEGAQEGIWRENYTWSVRKNSEPDDVYDSLGILVEIISTKLRWASHMQMMPDERVKYLGKEDLEKSL